MNRSRRTVAAGVATIGLAVGAGLALGPVIPTRDSAASPVTTPLATATLTQNAAELRQLQARLATAGAATGALRQRITQLQKLIAAAEHSRSASPGQQPAGAVGQQPGAQQPGGHAAAQPPALTSGPAPSAPITVARPARATAPASTTHRASSPPPSTTSPTPTAAPTSSAPGDDRGGLGDG